MKRRSSVVVPILVAALSFALATPASAGVIVDRALDDALPGAALSASPIMGSLSADTDPLDAFATTELHPGDSIGATLTCEAGVDFRLRLLRPGATSLDDSAAIVAEGVSVNHSVAATGVYTLVARAVSGSGGYSLAWSVSERVDQPDRPGHLVSSLASYTVTRYLDYVPVIRVTDFSVADVGNVDNADEFAGVTMRSDCAWIVVFNDSFPGGGDDPGSGEGVSTEPGEDERGFEIRPPSTVPGTYVGHVIFEADDADNSPLEVPVTYHLLPRRAAVVRLAVTFPSVIPYGQRGTVRGTLTDAAGRPLAGVVELQNGDGERIRGISVIGGSLIAPLTQSDMTARYRVVYAGTSRYARAATSFRTVTLRSIVSAPYVPQLVHTYVTYRMYGTVRPAHDAASPEWGDEIETVTHPGVVIIELQRYYGGRWLVEDTARTTQSGDSGAYTVSYRPVGWHEGRARVRAIDACSTHARVYSTWRYFTVID